MTLLAYEQKPNSLTITSIMWSPCKTNNNNKKRLSSMNSFAVIISDNFLTYLCLQHILHFSLQEYWSPMRWTASDHIPLLIGETSCILLFTVCGVLSYFTSLSQKLRVSFPLYFYLKIVASPHSVFRSKHNRNLSLFMALVTLHLYSLICSWITQCDTPDLVWC